MNTNTHEEPEFSIIGFAKGLLQNIIVLLVFMYVSKYAAAFLLIAIGCIHLVIIKKGTKTKHSGGIYFLICAFFFIYGTLDYYVNLD